MCLAIICSGDRLVVLLAALLKCTCYFLQAKAGVIGLTKTVAKEWGAYNIRCNGLAYGFIATRLTADKKGGASMQVGIQKAAGWEPVSADSITFYSAVWTVSSPKL